MLADAQIRNALAAMLHDIDPPPVPLHAIQERFERRSPAKHLPPAKIRLALATSAIVAVLFLALASSSREFIRTIEERVASILQWAPPPSPPRSLSSAISSQTATVWSAQQQVSFRIVPPAGLPNDITRRRVWMTPSLVYSKLTRKWSKGDLEITFSYDRTRHRSFELVADRFDPRFGRPPKYMFEDDSTNGRMLIRHPNFAWRNGNQEMSATASGDISVGEIEAIRDAMHGVPLQGAETHSGLNAGTLVKQIRLRKP